MKTVTIYKDNHIHVVSVEYRGKILYTRTYHYNEVGEVIHSVTVFASGGVDIQ